MFDENFNLRTTSGKDYPPYLVPCQDKKKITLEDLEYYYATVIPFMQFPLLTHGRPLTGQRIYEDVPLYRRDDNPANNHVYNHFKAIADYMEEHPNSPYVYSEWSAIPDDPRDFDIWAKYMALYQPMVEENSIAYIELRDCADILSPLPQDIYASMFVNEEKYLVVSNLTKEDYTLTLAENWTDRQTQAVSNTFTIKPANSCS